MLCQQRFADLRAKVAQVNHQCVAASLLHVLQRLHHVDLALHDADGALVHILAAVLFRVGLHQRFSSVDGQGLRETVTGNGDNADLDLRDVVHVFSSIF